MNNIIGFVRTSTMKQGNSIKVQEKSIRDYAKDKNLQLTDIIKEEGISGSRVDRQGFNTILKLVKLKQIDGVVCYWLSRAGRNASKVLELINSCLDNNVALMSVKEGIDTTTAGGRIQAKFMAVIAEEELLTIKERIKDVIRYKKKNGLVYNGSPAYGTYIKNGLLYKDDFEYNVVKNIKNWRSRGWSWYKCMKKLNENDIPTKMNTGRGWTINQVKQTFKYHYEGQKPQLIG